MTFKKSLATYIWADISVSEIFQTLILVLAKLPICRAATADHLSGPNTWIYVFHICFSMTNTVLHTSSALSPVRLFLFLRSESDEDGRGLRMFLTGQECAWAVVPPTQMKTTQRGG